MAMFDRFAFSAVASSERWQASDRWYGRRGFYWQKVCFIDKKTVEDKVRRFTKHVDKRRMKHKKHTTPPEMNVQSKSEIDGVWRFRRRVFKCKWSAVLCLPINRFAKLFNHLALQIQQTDLTPGELPGMLLGATRRSFGCMSLLWHLGRSS